MAAAEQFARNDRETSQAFSAQLLQVDAAFVVVQLPDEVILFSDARPAEQQIG